MWSEQDYELLSSYIDGTLDANERAALESRLAQDLDLRRELSAMRRTVMLVKDLPTLKAPRDFRLTTGIVHRRQPRLLRLLPMLSAAAAALVIMVLGATVLFNNQVQPPSASQVAIVSTALSQPTATILTLETLTLGMGEAMEEDNVMPFNATAGEEPGVISRFMASETPESEDSVAAVMMQQGSADAADMQLFETKIAGEDAFSDAVVGTSPASATLRYDDAAANQENLVPPIQDLDETAPESQFYTEGSRGRAEKLSPTPLIVALALMVLMGILRWLQV